jgi:hypothetical protein
LENDNLLCRPSPYRGARSKVRRSLPCEAGFQLVWPGCQPGGRGGLTKLFEILIRIAFRRNIKIMRKSDELGSGFSIASLVGNFRPVESLPVVRRMVGFPAFLLGCAFETQFVRKSYLLPGHEVFPGERISNARSSSGKGPFIQQVRLVTSGVRASGSVRFV